MPAGTRLMTEEERIKTLEELSRQRKDISDLIFSMPLTMKTEALKNKKREMESKLLDIERAITTFSRKVVYVKEEQEGAEATMSVPQIAETPVRQYGKFTSIQQ